MKIKFDKIGRDIKAGAQKVGKKLKGAKDAVVENEKVQKASKAVKAKVKEVGVATKAALSEYVEFEVVEDKEESSDTDEEEIQFSDDDYDNEEPLEKEEVIEIAIQCPNCDSENYKNTGLGSKEGKTTGEIHICLDCNNTFVIHKEDEKVIAIEETNYTVLG